MENLMAPGTSSSPFDCMNMWEKITGQTPSEMRVLGNQNFQNGDLERASICYGQALSHSKIDSQAYLSDKISCLSNLAEVYLRQESWHGAAKVAGAVLEIQSDHTKAKFRLAKAWSRIGKASEALGLLKGLRQCKSREIQNLAKDVGRIAKEELGEYDIPSMMKEATKRPGFQRLPSYHATFCSPKIAIGVSIDIPSSNGKTYRGCKALSNLKEGELIMSSRAFAMGLQRNIGIMMEEVVQNLSKAPCLTKDFFSLSDGRDGTHGIDEEALDDYDANDLLGKLRDLDRIRDIVRINGFSMLPYDETIRKNWNDLQQNSSKQRSDPLSSTEKVFGLHINESMLNNSCTPNCTWCNIGDQIFIYTTKPVKVGEELCISYYFNSSYEQRFERFSNWIRPGEGFECVCDHCQLLRRRDDLFRLGNEVHYGYFQAQELERFKGISKAQAYQAVIPPSRRREIFSAVSNLPLRFQHTPIAKLHEMEAFILAEEKDLDGALKASQLVAKINYEAMGSGKWCYFVDHWRIAGLAIACRKGDLARKSLEKVWTSPAFQAFPKKEAESIFRDLSHAFVKSTIPPVEPQYVREIEIQLGPLIDRMLNA